MKRTALLTLGLALATTGAASARVRLLPGPIASGQSTAAAQGSTPAPPAAAPARAGAGQAMTDSALDAQTRMLAEQLRCPVCQGVSIETSPTDLAREMRQVVREQLAAGRTPDQVKAYFVSKYGEWILLEPKAKGFNLAVYLLPFAVLLGGAALIFFAVRRWTRAPVPDDEGEAQDVDATTAGREA